MTLLNRRGIGSVIASAPDGRRPDRASGHRIDANLLAGQANDRTCNISPVSSFPVVMGLPLQLSSRAYASWPKAPMSTSASASIDLALSRRRRSQKGFGRALPCLSIGAQSSAMCKRDAPPVHCRPADVVCPVGKEPRHARAGEPPHRPWRHGRGSRRAGAATRPHPRAPALRPALAGRLPFTRPNLSNRQARIPIESARVRRFPAATFRAEPRRVLGSPELRGSAPR